MPTRLKRPAFWRPLALTATLVGFQGYLGYSAIGGQFGIDSQKQMHAEIEVLRARSSALQAEIDAFRHRVSLFDAKSLDPDILTERARALLNMAQADDVVVMIDAATGLPVSSSSAGLAGNQLTAIIEAESSL